MKSVPSPWLDVVVIGSPHEMVGIGARLAELRSADPPTGPIGREISNRLDKWCVLPSGAVPRTQQDVVFKLSRYALEGRTITWLGFYIGARLPRNSRANTYVGVGILTCNCSAPMAETLQYLRQLTHAMFENGEVQYTAAEFAAVVRDRMRPLFDPQVPRHGGLTEGSFERLYIDMNGLSESELTRRLPTVLEAAEVQSAYSIASEVLVGTTSALRQSVTASGSHRIMDPNSNATEPAIPAVAPVQRGAAGSRTRGHSYAQGDASQAGSFPDNPGDGWTTRRLDDHERRLSRLENGAPKPGPFSEPNEPKRGEWLLGTAIAAIVAAGVLGVLWIFFAERLFAPEPEPAPDEVFQHSTAVQDARCLWADTTDRTGTGLDKMREELECREQEIDSHRRRAGDLRDALGIE